MLRKLFFASLMGVSINTALAQVATDAVITGTVTDSTQSAIQGASITVVEVATGVVTKTTTNDLGQYRTRPLKIGVYTVAIESDGFKQYRESGVVLDIG